jgi:large subunit ribosomal protein L24
MSKLHIKKGDQVQVIAGDSKGQTGKVLKVEVSKQRAIVEGVNLCKKATKPNAQNPQGGIVERGSDSHFEPHAHRPQVGQTHQGRPQDGCKR